MYCVPTMHLQSVLIIFACAFSNVYCQTLPPPCNSSIYCYGDLLHTIQSARIFNDSKSFVDKKLIHSPETTLQDFDVLMKNQPTREKIIRYLDEHFTDGNELEEWTPQDFQPHPAFLHAIKNVTVANFTRNLISLWPVLARKVKDDVSSNPDRYSILPVPNGFIIPGGRFREYYYWDSYWIIQGLLISEMYDTARGMINNFVFLVQKYGFVPNGGRVYYLNRSQPPLLTAMAYNYYKHTADVNWLRNNIKHLDKELHFWLETRTVTVKKLNVTLAHYSVPSTGPRPESYAEDFQTASAYENSTQQQIYVDLKSGAESGWDFSSRWFFDEGGETNASLSQIRTTRVIPVDLNAYLCGAFRDIARMYLELNDGEKSDFWMKKYNEWKKSIESIFWNEADGIWYDFDLKLLKSRKYFFPSNVAPLWSRCYDHTDGDKLGGRVAKYLKDEGILNHFGGIPTSLKQSGEQWDLPNAWPPLQDIVIEGLRLTGNADAQKTGEELARRWINANILGWGDSGEMFEKYDADSPGKYGGGGEYAVQSGFGWSNGVCLKFIYEYYRVV